MFSDGAIGLCCVWVTQVGMGFVKGYHSIITWIWERLIPWNTGILLLYFGSGSVYPLPQHKPDWVPWFDVWKIKSGQASHSQSTDEQGCHPPSATLVSWLKTETSNLSARDLDGINHLWAAIRLSKILPRTGWGRIWHSCARSRWLQETAGSLLIPTICQEGFSSPIFLTFTTVLFTCERQKMFWLLSYGNHSDILCDRVFPWPKGNSASGTLPCLDHLNYHKWLNHWCKNREWGTQCTLLGIINHSHIYLLLVLCFLSSGLSFKSVTFFPKF